MQKLNLFFLMQLQKTQNFIVKKVLNDCQKFQHFCF